MHTFKAFCQLFPHNKVTFQVHTHFLGCTSFETISTSLQYLSGLTVSSWDTLINLNDRTRQHIGAPFFGHKSPAARARELFKPSTDSASLLVVIEKKKFFVLGLSFSGGNVTSRGVFAFFWPHLPGPRCCTNGTFFDLKFSWKLGQNPRLWSLWMTS